MINRMALSKHTKLFVILGLMLGLTLGTLDTTIVSTAMPRIVGMLGGLSLYPWVFSIYLLTSTTTVPLYGKLADLYGRKPIFLFGMFIFLVGSVACTLAQNMEQLIIFRAIQGIGAGAIIPLVLTIVADISETRDERNRLQGLLGAIWGISSIAGPSLGGLIVDHLPWQWVFYLNLPFGLLSIGILAVVFKESVQRQKRHLDYLGTVLLTGAIIALLLNLQEGGTAWDWISLPSIGLFLLTIILVVWFVRVEQRAEEPIVPLSLFKSRIIAIASLGGICLGGVMFGIISYVPLFVQGVQGRSATEAGLVQTPELLSWSLISVCIAVIIRALGYQRTVRMGAFIAVLGTGLLVLATMQSTLYLLLASMVIIGCGLGMASNVFTLSVQNAAPKNLIGVASASTQFVRTIGGTIGVAVMGAVLNGQMTQRFAPIMQHFTAVATRLPSKIAPANLLLTPALRVLLPASLLAQLQAAMTQSLFWVYALIFALSLLILVVILRFPGDHQVERQEK